MLKNNNKIGLAIHGGTSSIKAHDFPSDLIIKYKTYLKDLTEKYYVELENGMSALDCVEKVISDMEDSGLYNAGRGSILDSNGFVNMDSSIMFGENLSFGSLYGAHNIKNPILFAKNILLKNGGCYNFNSINEAYNYCKSEFVENKYFDCDKPWLRLYKNYNNCIDNKYGTVGCVALDNKGNLASGTSTGGLIYKYNGRISDVCIIGAGTYANNSTCAISCSGHGESIIRHLISFSIHSIIFHLNKDLSKALEQIFTENKFQYNLGVIGIDKNGFVKIKYNSSFMFYSYKSFSQDICSVFDRY